MRVHPHCGQGGRVQRDDWTQHCDRHGCKLRERTLVLLSDTALLLRPQVDLLLLWLGYTAFRVTRGDGTHSSLVCAVRSIDVDHKKQPDRAVSKQATTFPKG